MCVCVRVRMCVYVHVYWWPCLSVTHTLASCISSVWHGMVRHGMPCRAVCMLYVMLCVVLFDCCAVHASYRLFEAVHLSPFLMATPDRPLCYYHLDGIQVPAANARQCILVRHARLAKKLCCVLCTLSGLSTCTRCVPGSSCLPSTLPVPSTTCFTSSWDSWTEYCGSRGSTPLCVVSRTCLYGCNSAILQFRIRLPEFFAQWHFIPFHYNTPWLCVVQYGTCMGQECVAVYCGVVWVVGTALVAASMYIHMYLPWVGMYLTLPMYG